MPLCLGVALNACGEQAEPMPDEIIEQADALAADAVIGDAAMDEAAMEQAAMDEAAAEPVEVALPVAEDGALVVELDLSEYAIDSPTMRFSTDVNYRFAIKNTGVLSHELRILPRGTSAEMLEMTGAEHAGMGQGHEHASEVVLTSGEDLPASTWMTRDYMFREPGEFELACHLPGHLEGGMLLFIDVAGEAMPVTEDDITVDLESMAGFPCHSMGTMIMGDCSPEDIERLKREIIEGSAGEMPDDDHAADEGMAGDEVGDDEAGDDDSEDGAGDEGSGDDSSGDEGDG